MKKTNQGEKYASVFHPYPHKFLLIMKLTVILSCVLSFNVFASVYSQTTRFNIELREKSVKEVFKNIEGQSEFRFFYNSDFTALDNKVNVNASGATIEELLAVVLKNTDVSYKVMDNNFIVITPGKEQQIRITGRITDAKTGDPLPGVTVLAKGTTIGATSGIDGSYLVNVPVGATSLIFSFIGYQAQEVLIGERVIVNVDLEEEVTALDEVVVIGYGTKVKSSVTGSISTVNANEIKNLPATTVAEALEGRISGAFVTESSGKPGASSNIYLRGPISISGGNPLYIVDGVPVPDLDYSFNMEDIESINVLKDASAASIYGAKAAGGVILVTTKRGSNKKPQINVVGNYGIRNVIDLPVVFQRDEYIRAKQLAGYDVTSLFGPESGWISLPDTDWFDEWYNPGAEQNYTISVNGGGEASTYYISGNFNSIEGTLLNNFINRYTFRINSDHKILKNLKFTENFYVKTGVESTPVTPGNGFLTFRSIPMMPVYDPSNLEGGWGKTPTGFQGSNNVARTSSLHNRNKDYSANLSGGLEYTLLKDLNLKAFFGTTLAFIDSYAYQSPFNDGAFSMLQTFSKGMAKSQQYIATYTANYNHDFNGHQVTALVGYEARKSNSANVIYRNQDSFVPMPASSTQAMSLKNLSSDFMQTDVLDRMLSQFLRVEYAYRNKYLLTANIRRDGYGSKFGPENKFGIFPGMSMGWVISQEEFMNTIDIIDLLKLRAGYGVLGNAVGQDFAYTSYYESGNPYDWSQNGGFNKQVGISLASRLANPEIQWESVATTNFGFDLNLFKSRISINFDYYSRQTKKMLYNIPISPAAGVGSSVQANIGQMSNKGMELQIAHRNEIGDFAYNAGFNLGYNKNELISLDPTIDRLYISSGDIGTGESGQGFYGLVYPCRSEPGQPLGQFYGLQTAGIWASDAATGELRPTYSGYIPRAGDLIYVDQNADGVINALDMTTIGNPWPKFTYGISMGASWKGIELKAQFSGVLGNEIYNAFESWEYNFFSDYNTTSNIYKTSFFGSNELTSIPRTGTLSIPDRNKNWGAVSDYHVQSGSYMRLKNLQLGYNLPASVLKTVNLTEATLFISADNLLTITKYKGMDPAIPPQNGSILAQGLDFTSQRYPNSRLISMGISLTF